jgi:NTE family protein
MQALEDHPMITAGKFWQKTRNWLDRKPAPAARTPRIGLALGGGFARGIAHAGVLRVLAEHNIPIDAIAGVSAGSVVAAAFASGASVTEIEAAGKQMRFKDVARWTISKLGLAGTDRMIGFMNRLLKVQRFEEMQIPLAVVATDLGSGKPVVFRTQGEVISPIRASCSFPGLFQPMRYENRYLVDGFVSMEVPAHPLRSMGATHVIAVSIPNVKVAVDPSSMLAVIDRCFQAMSHRLEREWRQHADLVIEPDVSHVPWDAFDSADKLIALGEQAALAALPDIKRWFASPREVTDRLPRASRVSLLRG